MGRVLHLNPGTNRLGRNPANAIRFTDPSVSAFHCEVIVSGETVLVRDLGSTNGTAIDNDLIQEQILKLGQTLQLGSIRMRLETEAEPDSFRVAIPEIAPINRPPPPPLLPDGSAACLNHPELGAIFECATCHYSFCEECVRTVGVAGGRSMHFCLNCDGQCRPIHRPVNASTVLAAPTKGKTFFGRLTQTLKLPFKR